MEPMRNPFGEVFLDKVQSIDLKLHRSFLPYIYLSGFLQHLVYSFGNHISAAASLHRGVFRTYSETISTISSLEFFRFII